MAEKKLFTEQYQRLFLTWKNARGIRTQDELFKRLNITQMEFIRASREGILPRAWLTKTANALNIDVTYIETGETVKSA